MEENQDKKVDLKEEKQETIMDTANTKETRKKSDNGKNKKRK